MTHGVMNIDWPHKILIKVAGKGVGGEPNSRFSYISYHTDPNARITLTVKLYHYGIILDIHCSNGTT